MNRSRIIVVVLAFIAAIGLGLGVANLFGSNRTGNATVFTAPTAAAAVAATAPPAPTGDLSAASTAPASTAAARATTAPTAASAATAATVKPTTAATAKPNVAATSAPDATTSATNAPDATTSATSAPDAPAIAYTEYAVKRGDSIKLLARRYGVTVNEILLLNPDLPNPDSLTVGDIIRIPQKS